MTEPAHKLSQRLTVAFAVLVALAIAAGATRLIPEAYRPWNLAAIGGLALFAGSRLKLGQAIAITCAAMLASDAVLYVLKDRQMEFLPSLGTYISYAVYVLLGARLLRDSENPIRIGSVALAASVVFFVVTNFVSWLTPIHGYELSLSGLLNCYERAVPFYRGTFIGDMLFSGLFFGVAMVLGRVLAPQAAAFETVVGK
jgi:hypothetical protein